MPCVETLLVFTAAAVLMNLSPGPSNFYVLSVTLAQGRGAGTAAVGGLALGGLAHVAAAALGVSVLFAYSPAAYTALKLLGAGYLLYLGVTYWLAPAPSATAHPARSMPPSRGRIVSQSALVEITNPKTALFFLAFLPQFVDLSAGPPAPQLLLLGAIVTLSAIPCDLLVAFSTDRAAAWMQRHPGFERLQRRVSGSILIVLGAYVALDERSPA